MHTPVLLFVVAAVEIDPLVMLLLLEEDAGVLPVLPCSLPCSIPCPIPCPIPCSISSLDVAVAMISRARGCRGAHSGPRDERSTRN